MKSYFRLSALILFTLSPLLLCTPAVVHAQWEPDVRLTNNSADSQSPSVVVSGSEVHVVWGDLRDGTWENYYKRSTDGGTSWGADLRLTNNDGAHSLNSSVAVSGTSVHVVWTETRDGNPEIYTMRSTDGGTSWSSDLRLSTNDGADSYNPSMAISGNRVHVVWNDFRDGNAEIYYKRNPTGNIGVEEEMQNEKCKMQITKLQINPNPFASFTTVPGHEGERFVLYDIAGRKVGNYSGNRIGEGLAPGVYFIRSSGNKDKPLRIVKVR